MKRSLLVLLTVIVFFFTTLPAMAGDNLVQSVLGG